MQEEQRKIRAVSQDTERPYFEITYRLSLSGKELLSSAFDSNNSAETQTATAVLAAAAAANVERRRSHTLGGVQSAIESMSITSLKEELPGTPKQNYLKKSKEIRENKTTNSNNIKPAKFSLDEDSLVIFNKGQGTFARRTKSTLGEIEFELNRAAPINRSTFEHENRLDDEELATYTQFQGLITCLNSKNIGKYRVGQHFKTGIIIGIDEEQSKIIVYIREMPRGSLCVLRTRNAARYEKGYPILNVQGLFIGRIHAIDRLQNLLVVNVAEHEHENHLEHQSSTIPIMVSSSLSS